MTTLIALTDADIFAQASTLLSARGLCHNDYEGPSGELDPSGAVAVVLGMPADVWCNPPEHVTETAAYQAGIRALHTFVKSLGYQMRLPAGRQWDGEGLANHVAFWLEDARPTLIHVVERMSTVIRPDRQVSA